MWVFCHRSASIKKIRRDERKAKSTRVFLRCSIDVAQRRWTNFPKTDWKRIFSVFSSSIGHLHNILKFTFHLADCWSSRLLFLSEKSTKLVELRFSIRCSTERFCSAWVSFSSRRPTIWREHIFKKSRPIQRIRIQRRTTSSSTTFLISNQLFRRQKWKNNLFQRLNFSFVTAEGKNNSNTNFFPFNETNLWVQVQFCSDFLLSSDDSKLFIIRQTFLEKFSGSLSSSKWKTTERFSINNCLELWVVATFVRLEKESVSPRHRSIP